MQNFFKSSLVTSTLLAALGILLIFESEVTIATISYIIGAVLVVAGVFAFLRYLKTNQKGLETSELDILYGIVTIIIGTLVIRNPHVIASIIPLILGIAIIISSASKIQYAFDLKNANNDMWKTTMVVALISSIFGIVLIFNPFAGAVLIMRIIGIFILVYAILDIISTIIIRKNVSEFNVIIEKETENIVEAEVVKENDAPSDKKSKSKKQTTSSKKTTTKKKATNNKNNK